MILMVKKYLGTSVRETLKTIAVNGDIHFIFSLSSDSVLARKIVAQQEYWIGLSLSSCLMWCHCPSQDR